MSIVNQFNVFCDNEVKHLVNEIKLFYLTKYNLLFQTFDDSVFHYDLRKYKLKKFESFYVNHVIIKFDCSNNSLWPHYMALTDNGRVYSWGNNSSGQLGRYISGDYCITPTLINSLSEDIIDICCGRNHSLVLTRNGNLFAFGNNFDGQCGNNSEPNQLTPIKINKSSKVTAISCGNHHSIALTEDGDVFGWGIGELGIGSINRIQNPMQLNVPKIKQIVCGSYYTIMLSIDGDVYYCGDNCLDFSHNIPTQLNSITKFIKVAATIHSELCVAESDDNKIFIFGSYRNANNEIERIKTLQQTKFTTIDETYAFYEQIKFKLINHVNESKYKNNFTEYNPIGKGGFATVFKCENKFDNKMYAMKKVSFEPKEALKVKNELNMLSKLESDFVVKHIDSWIEHNYYNDINYNDIINRNQYNWYTFHPNSTRLLHIQMELCSFTLEDAINKISDQCKKPNNISLIGYYISSELLNEVLECVHYLHSQNPAIIHRDLKPENILLTNFINNRFVKISDFGISTFHEFTKQSHSLNKGTRSYMAPEILRDRHYNTSADLYSLGCIMEELFLLNDMKRRRTYTEGLKTKMTILKNLITKLTDRIIPDNRPNCEQILQEKHNWLLTDEELLNDSEFEKIINKTSKTNSIEENFVEFFIQNKYPQTLNRDLTPQSSALSSHIDVDIEEPTTLQY